MFKNLNFKEKQKQYASHIININIQYNQVKLTVNSNTSVYKSTDWTKLFFFVGKHCVDNR